jgi:hypothetical protein
MKPLSIQEKSNKNIPKNQETENLNDVDYLNNIVLGIDENIKNLLITKQEILDKIQTIKNSYGDVDNSLKIIVDIAGKGKFENVIYEKIDLDNTFTRFTFRKYHIENILQSSYDYKQKFFHVRLHNVLTNVLCTIRYNVDNIDNSTNTVIASYEIST